VLLLSFSNRPSSIDGAHPSSIFAVIDELRISDLGANHLQNLPVLTAASRDDDDIIIEGTLSSAPNTTYGLEFFSNPDCDPSNYGEGKRSLGSKEVKTD